MPEFVIKLLAKENQTKPTKFKPKENKAIWNRHTCYQSRLSKRHVNIHKYNIRCSPKTSFSFFIADPGPQPSQSHHKWNKLSAVRKYRLKLKFVENILSNVQFDLSYFFRQARRSGACCYLDPNCTLTDQEHKCGGITNKITHSLLLSVKQRSVQESISKHYQAGLFLPKQEKTQNKITNQTTTKKSKKSKPNKRANAQMIHIHHTGYNHSHLP